MQERKPENDMRQTLATKAVPMDNETPAAANEPLPERPAMPSAAELYEMIAEAAYYRAQKRGFSPGLEAQDWADAEAEVRERVRARHTATTNGADDGQSKKSR
jgi:hypothetical protein